ncbi:unnamed protein product [Brachionus calyciflorus]|uniref:Uncharacterized protein n=1 Tax=Brachionus calyciflorus TaxID=104777 RepID=A0A813TDW3_9BILA|nr:unnamed protein product [Brachionus calyciflorus]
MGHSQSSINPKKSYYSVEYLNADFENELNKMIQSKSEQSKLQAFSNTSIYESLNTSIPNKYQCLNENCKNTTSSQDLSMLSDENFSHSGVERTKSFAKPENRVLPPLFKKKQLRQTNLLKTDGSKKTWRNSSKLKKSNSTILESDNILKPSLIKNILNKSIPNLSNNDKKSYDESSFESIDHNLNLIDTRKISSLTKKNLKNQKNSLTKSKSFKTDQDIRVISGFPINSKVYRHYISGNSDVNFDKLTNCIEVGSILNKMDKLKTEVNKKDPDPTYDSINEYKSNKSSSSFSLTSSSNSSTFSSITKSSDMFYNIESTKKTYFDSTANDSSLFSALTSSSLINSSHSINPKYQNKFVSSINITNPKPKFQSDYNNNFNVYNNDKNNGTESEKDTGSSKSLNEVKESDYDFLSNAKSGCEKKLFRSVSNKVTNERTKSSPNLTEETKRLNEIFQHEIQKAYEERSKRFDQAKKVLESDPENLVNLNAGKKFPTFRGIDIRSKIRAIEENIMKQDFQQSKSSAFRKIEPKSSEIQKSNTNSEIPNFYLRPPINYDDTKIDTTNNLQEQEVKIDFSESKNLNSKIKFIEIVDSKFQKFKFIPDDQEQKDNFDPTFFNTPPPPPEYTDDYGFLHLSDSVSDSNSDTLEKIAVNKKSNNNFILKPKESDINLFDKDLIPGVILVESQNNSKQNSKIGNSNNKNRSFCKGRRKGLDEVFPEIRLNKQKDYEYFSKTDAEWCPASDLPDFDLEDTVYLSNYQNSMCNENPNYALQGANFRKDLFKKNLFLDNLQSERNEYELNQIFDQPVQSDFFSHKLDYSELVNSIENFYY